MAPPVRICDFGDEARAVRDYFSNPFTRTARDLLSAIEDACDASDNALATDLWMDMAATIRVALEAGSAGAPADGSALMNGLLSEFLASGIQFPCVAAGTCDALTAGDLPINFTPSLAALGAWQTVGGDASPAHDGHVVDDPSAPVFARAPQDPNGSSAIWTVQVPSAQPSWSQVVRFRALVHGAPPAASLILRELALAGGTQFEWEVFPHPVGGFTDPSVIQPAVGVCRVPPAVVNFLEAIQREGNLLQDAPAGFPNCASVESLAFSTTEADHAGAWLTRLASLNPFRAEPLFAAIQGRRAGTAGMPSDFSKFADVDAILSGRVVVLQGAPAVIVENQPFSIVLQAVTDNGTPVELVGLTASIQGNNASFGLLSGSITAVTQEGTDYSDSGQAAMGPMSVNKPGGFTVCVSAQHASIAFDDGCFTFHVRNQ